MRTLCALLIVLYVPEELLAIVRLCGDSLASRSYQSEFKKDDYTYFAALVEKSAFQSIGELKVSCGATLISEKKILTAAACYHGHSQKTWKNLYLAIFNLKNRCKRSYAGVNTIKKVVLHPKYDPETGNFDFAIATLNRTVLYQPLCIAPKGEKYDDNEEVFTIGFGRTDEYDPMSAPCEIARINIKVFKRKQCINSEMKNEFLARSSVICAGDEYKLQDSCMGVRGDPLVRSIDGIYVLQGVASFGKYCRRPNSPTMYVDASKQWNWIQKELKNKTTLLGRLKGTLSGLSN